jgi:hypothetical protein
VASDNRYFHVQRVQTFGFGYESVGANHVQSGDSEETFGVVFAGFFQDFGGDGDGGVDGVGDDADQSIGGVLSRRLDDVSDDGGVGVEEVVTGHARPSGTPAGIMITSAPLKASFMHSAPLKLEFSL